MDVKLKVEDLVDLVREEVSRLGATLTDDQGAGLYDSIKITSRDTGVIGRMLDEAKSAVLTQCHRFIDHSVTTEDGMVEFYFSGTDRRFDGKEDTITDLLENILVKMVVSKYLVSKGLVTNAQVYDQQAASDIALLSKNLYVKLPPKK